MKILSLTKYIWNHPSNQHQRFAALGKFVWWQYHKRMRGTPILVRLGERRVFKIVKDSQFSSLAIYTGLPEWGEMRFLERILRPEDTFIDIGANVGFYTIFASALIGSGAIVSIEANPSNISVLEDQIRLNALTNVTVLPRALSDVNGTLSFSAERRETGRIGTASHGNHTTVKSVRLDDVLSSMHLQGVLIAKMDIEGAEYLALKGAVETLRSKRIPIWLFELSENNLRRLNASAKSVVELFVTHGYRLLSWDEDAKCLRAYSEEEMAVDGNLVACSDMGLLESRLRENVAPSIAATVIKKI